VNLRGDLTAGWRKLLCEKLNHLYSSPGVHKFRATKYCTLAPNIFSVVIAVLFFAFEKVYQFTRTEHKAPDNRTVGCQYATSFLSPFWRLEFGVDPRFGGEICGPLL
jgi:hypothetical protein